jgi:hypothetical protein
VSDSKNIVSSIDLGRKETSVLTYRNQNGKLLEMHYNAVAQIPADFGDTLNVLINDLQLALDCIDLFGGVPVPVAQSIIRKIEPAHAAIDMAVRAAHTPESEAH